MGRLLLCDASGPVEDLLQKLSGGRGDEWLEALKKMLRQGPKDAQGTIAAITPWFDALAQAYKLLRLSAEYAQFMREHPPKAIFVEHWLLPVLKGASCGTIITVLRELGIKVNLHHYKDLDREIVVNDRDPNRDGSYFISVKSAREADEENKIKSAEELPQQDIRV